MAKKTAPLLPMTELRLQQFGKRLRLVRLRRHLTGKQVAERAGMTPVTLRSLERGSSGVTIGAYLAVMQVLGVEADLDFLLKNDPLGRDLQDAALTRRSRGTRQKTASVAVPSPSTGKRQSQAIATDWMTDGSFTSTDNLAALIKPPTSDKKRR